MGELDLFLTRAASSTRPRPPRRHTGGPGTRDRSLGVSLYLTGRLSTAIHRRLGHDNSGFMNPTLVREMLTASVLRAFQPMPQTAYVRVHANGEYFGIYTLVQQIERTFLGDWFESNDGVLFKGDAPGGGRAAADEPDQGPDGFRSNLGWLGKDSAAIATRTSSRPMTRVNPATRSCL